MDRELTVTLTPRLIRWTLLNLSWALFLFAPSLWAQSSVKLSAELIWDGTITLNWTDIHQVDASGYNLYYCKYPDPNFIKLDTMPAGTDFCHWNKGGRQGETYLFFIQASRKGAAPWESENSNSVTVTITQELLQEAKIKEGVIDIGRQAGMGTNFGEPSKNGLKGYNIYFGDKEDGLFIRVNPQPIANVPTYLVRNLVVGKKYYFQFSAVRADGMESARSKNVSFIAITYEQLQKSLPDRKSI